VRKKAGRIQELARLLNVRPAAGSAGISHTRWATHGPANDRNAHPHVSADGLCAVVHNGVIENYATLRRQLTSEGIAFQSDTDTEVIAQLIGQRLALLCDGQNSPPSHLFIDAVAKTLPLLKGTYGLAVVSPLFPGMIVGARLGSPLVVGVGEGENLLASDASALLGKTQKVVYMHDHQMCVLTGDDWHVLDQDRARVEVTVHEIEWEAGDTDKGDYEHHMLKEIHEQPEALENALRGRLSESDATAHFGGLNVGATQLR